jgi:eukaryotic-like serine/threonine-protein kinase
MQMTSDNWDRAKELFEAALELESSQRASFLAENCGEESIRRQVEELLINYQEAGSFLDDPVLTPAPNAPSEIPREEASRPHPEPEELLATATSVEAADPMVGRHLGDYKIVRRIGQGGMAAVFLAVRADDAYRKQVAIKLVQPGVDSGELLSRFRNERQTLAGLDHPNIVKLLDGGSTPEGLSFMVMDYVEGSPIDDYCDRHKLCIDERLHLFSKVCEAVQYAHQQSVVHRDLKPSNILVTADGTPRLLDFGIAKVLNPQPSAQSLVLTHTGTRCMTPAYASPEQMHGRSVTPATDIYSLGVVLYELLSGHRPYRLREDTPSEIERAICEQEPDAPSAAVSRVESVTSSDGVPVTRTPELVSETREGQPERLRRRLRGDLDNIVLKALQKEPERRYGSVEEFLQDIGRHLQHLPVKARRSTLTYRASRFVQRHKTEAGAALLVTLALGAAAWFAFNNRGLRDRVLGGAPVPRIQSLAVLPLANLSGDPAQDYFADGMTDELITDLAQIGSVKVISRTSILRYKKTDKSLPEIARELNVDGIVEGSVRRSGDRVRITAQLIHGPSDKHLWANSYERDMHDVFALERDVTGEIARQVHARLTQPDQAPAAPPRPANPKALEAYLQGNYHLSGFGSGAGDEEKKKAQEYFQQAIDADPNFAPAYDGLANAHLNLPWGSSQDFEIATKAAERAVALDPNSSDAHCTLGSIRSWPGSEEEFRRAIALNPNSAGAHASLGDLLDRTGRLDEGWREQQIAQELDPNHDLLSSALDRRGQHDRAMAMVQMRLKRDPDDGYLHVSLYRHYVRKGMYKEAIQELEKTLSLFGFPEISTHIDHAFVVSGFRGAMRQFAEELEHLIATKQVFLPVNLAEVYTTLGDKDRAFYWLEQAYSHRDIHVASTDISLGDLDAEFLLDPLRSDPRFKDLVRRVGLPQ